MSSSRLTRYEGHNELVREPQAIPRRYARWGHRFGAWSIDVVLLVGVITVLAVLIDQSFTSEAAEEAAAYLLAFTLVSLWPLYFAICHSRERGQTLGKGMARIAVRDGRTGGRLSLGRALGRAYFMSALYAAFMIPFVVDVLWPLWDPRRQALHDKVVDTVVVRTAG